MAKAQPQTLTTETLNPLTNAYDDVPYESHPYPQTHPLLAQGIGKLFGLSAPAPDNARILEIGCAAGANCVAVATAYPSSTCIGIDYSLKQIEAGRKVVKALGIKNLELKHMSVMDVTPSLGQFDYIVCHGVLSWVPPEVREQILKVCKANLAPDGIANISYNTLPGWNCVRSIRDMMLYHTERFADPVEKVQQARAMLKFMNDSTKNNKNTMAQALERELQVLTGQPDYYLLHDHLEKNNTAFYFYEFMEKAKANGLQYLADTSIESMYSGNLPDEVAKVLATSDDIVRTEQYMDFINDRRFRQTLLCHNDHILSRNISAEILSEGWISSRFGYPEGFAGHDIQSGTVLEFQAGGRIKYSTNDVLTLILMQVLMETKREPVRIAAITSMVSDKLASKKLDIQLGNGATLEMSLCFILMRQIFTGGIVFYMDKMPYVSQVSEKPEASELVRYQVKHQDWVSNRRQEYKALSAFDKLLVGYLDGARDAAALVECMLPHFLSKELFVNQNNVPIEDVAVIKSIVPKAVAERLGVICEMALLVG